MSGQLRPFELTSPPALPGREAPHVPALTPTEGRAGRRPVSRGREEGNEAGQ